MERLPLGKIFNNGSNGREYLFSARKNIRDYEWTVEKEAEDLFESIMSLDESGPSELELGQMTIMKKT